MKANIRNNYRFTIYACYLGYIVQGIINNVSPILFVTYQNRLGISLDKIGILIAVNFGVQILIDIVAAKYVDKIGYRLSMILAHIFSTIGLIGIGVTPFFFNTPFAGLLTATILNGIGGGLLEVLVSPIVEAAPSEKKDKVMSMLHSFYCWGCVGFIAISTIALRIISQEYWYVLPIVWSAVPILNCILFGFVPIGVLVEDGEQMSFHSLCRKKIFWILIVFMLCAGASEMGMSQWASYFAEIGLGVNKTFGDILGPCFFSFMMGIARLIYGKSDSEINLNHFMAGSCVLCVCSYLLAVFAPIPVLGLIGCGLCGLSVGILWPGTFSIAARECKAGGTTLFALLALAGDIGCISGPELVSIVSGKFPFYGLKAGLLAAVIFPVILLIGILVFVLERKFVKQ
ncbi:MFS transporter [Anaeromicropila populeti]|uniref:Fucose permease n=1 Tax=Anaeromicropila populeti TaxID=37658 RepID=A0A1I6JMG4_9FIRM|nr:MFS transporter [Anaeromicropila populeti]SFR80163.1 Fucose permease [Anaeromicropila populeti]